MDVAQLTPTGSGCSIVVGTLPAQREMVPGSVRGLQLRVRAERPLIPAAARRRFTE